MLQKSCQKKIRLSTSLFVSEVKALAFSLKHKNKQQGTTENSIKIVFDLFLWHNMCTIFFLIDIYLSKNIMRVVQQLNEELIDLRLQHVTFV